MDRSRPVVMLLDALNARDLDEVRALLAADFVFEEVAASGEPSRAAFVAEIELIFAGLSDVMFRPVRLSTEGDRDFLEFRAVGEQTGKFLGIPATGAVAIVSGVFNVIEDNEHIHALRWTIDYGGLRRQLLTAAQMTKRPT